VIISPKMCSIMLTASCAIALSLGGAAAAGPAAAATAARQAPAAAGLHSTASTGTVHGYQNANGDPCETYEGEDNLYSGSTLLAFVLYTTSFCYNGVIVTSHANSFDPVVTSAGANQNWEYLDGQFSWHCYDAAGTTRTCSGNVEYETEYFQKCVEFRGCSSVWYPEIQQDQNYKGQTFIFYYS
jgi:hypothetical protein